MGVGGLFGMMMGTTAVVAAAEGAPAGEDPYAGGGGITDLDGVLVVMVVE